MVLEVGLYERNEKDILPKIKGASGIDPEFFKINAPFLPVVLGLGRALGETMAVTMVIGNRYDISASLFAPGYTLAAVIANEFAEAFSPRYLSALAGLAVVLLGTTLILNAGARLLVRRVKGAA